MAEVTQTSESNGSCVDLLRAINLFGLSDSISSPGAYTCYKRLDLFELELGILPGAFTAAEIVDLFKAAAFTPNRNSGFSEEPLRHAA
jgi:hypothetical protein